MLKNTDITRMTAAGAPVVASGLPVGVSGSGVLGLGAFARGGSGSGVLARGGSAGFGAGVDVRTVVNAPVADATAVPGAVLPVAVERDERPTEAPVAAGAAAEAYAAACIAAGAEADSKRVQHLTMWPFRGPEPWRDPT